ncbi:helix-turn-helix domain-containing protein [Sphingobium aquiterrae]|uniref:TetR/AcrR family transcriptional regulator n=1 Tax=Sphingobium aquiterrae TaxID=2038656 RepID=UPI0030162EF5
MNTKKIAKGRGRPRGFDVDAALDKAQALFHAHGYDGVGVAAIVEALGINPPSFYAAFGSKADLFDRVLGRYAPEALPVERLLVPGARPAAALRELLHEAARIYTADDGARGCLVLEHARGGAAEAAVRARRWKEANAARLHDFLMPACPGQAAAVADYVITVLSGMSVNARDGMSADQLMVVADMAGLAIAVALEGVAA